MPSRRDVLALIATASAVTLVAPMASAKEKWFIDGGYAIRGYDPVAYFTAAAPVLGDDAFTSAYDGATFRFASAENKALFDGAPAKYAPQFGGYCAYAVSKGGTAPTQPDAWTVYEDKLYLNFNTSVREIWSEDIPGNIAKATANWPGVLED